jgi:hypothetical protein
VIVHLNKSNLVVVRSKNLLNCSVLIRTRTWSWATTSEPLPARFSLPPVWSPCQCVFSTNRGGSGFSLASASMICGDAGAYWSSIRITPSSPTNTPMLPPLP